MPLSSSPPDARDHNTNLTSEGVNGPDHEVRALRHYITPRHQAPTVSPKVQRLKSALWLHVGRVVDNTYADSASELSTSNATPQFIAALTELLYAQIGTVAVDLESFARHAGRTVVTDEDVLLLARRNESLRSLMRDEIEKAKARAEDEEKGGGAVKRKR